MTTTIKVQYVNDVKPGKKMGSVKTDTGEYYSIPAMAVQVMKPDTTYEVEYTTRQWEGKTYKTITNFQEKPNGGGEQPPQTSPQSRDNGGNHAPMSKDDYWARKEGRDISQQPRIERQSARRDAIAFHAYECSIAGNTPSVDRVKELTAIFEAML